MRLKKNETPPPVKRAGDTRLLGLDPGFASIGWVVININNCAMVNNEALIGADVLRTTKADKKQNTYAADDNFRRAKEIGRELSRIVDLYQVDAVCAEAMSFPRSSSVAAKMAMCWGVIAQICVTRNLPIAQATPKAIKKNLTGTAAASKDDVQAALSVRFPETIGMIGHLPKGLYEHVFDSAGAVAACLQSDIILAVTETPF